MYVKIIVLEETKYFIILFLTASIAGPINMKIVVVVVVVVVAVSQVIIVSSVVIFDLP